MIKKVVNKIKSILTFDNLLLLLAFLVGFNVLGYGNICFIAFIVLFIIKSFICNELKIHKGILLVSLFAISFFAIYTINYSFSITSLCYYLAFPICGYLIGSSIINEDNNYPHKFMRIGVMNFHPLKRSYSYLDSNLSYKHICVLKLNLGKYIKK